MTRRKNAARPTCPKCGALATVYASKKIQWLQAQYFRCDADGCDGHGKRIIGRKQSRSRCKNEPSHIGIYNPRS